MNISKINVLLLIKYSFVIAIATLIIGSVYYLVSAVQVLHLILQQYDRASRLEPNDYPNNQLTKMGREIIEKHGKSFD